MATQTTSGNAGHKVTKPYISNILANSRPKAILNAISKGIGSREVPGESIIGWTGPEGAKQDR